MALFQLNNQSLPSNSASYSPAPTSPPLTCSGNARICTIDANDDGTGHPELDENILSEMVTALNTRTNTSNVKLKS
jgi:hypothetical protein